MGGYKRLKFDDFLKLIERKIKETQDTETYYEVFKMFDKEETGYISASEIKYMMTNLGENLTDQEVNEMLSCDIRWIISSVEQSEMVLWRGIWDPNPLLAKKVEMMIDIIGEFWEKMATRYSLVGW